MITGAQLRWASTRDAAPSDRHEGPRGARRPLRGGLTELTASLRIAGRSLLRRPGPSLAAIVTLGVGAGVVTATASVAHAVLWAPLPYPEPEELRQVVWEEDGRRSSLVPAEGVARLRETVSGQVRLGLARFQDVALLVGESPRRVRGVIVSGETLPMLGVEPTLGRLPTPAEDLPGGACLAVLGQGIWQEVFGAERRVVGSTVRLASGPCTVVGVMPPDFAYPKPYFAPGEMWLLPGPARAELEPDGGPGFLVFARGGDGELSGALGDASRATLAGRFVATRWSEGSRSASRDRLMLLLVAAVLVLVLASLNYSVLRFARTWERRPELATRVALGAGGLRVLALEGVETLVLGTLGGAAGVGVAASLVVLIQRLRSFHIPRMEEASLGGGMAAACVGLGVAVAMLGAAWPTLRALSGANGSLETLRQGRGSRFGARRLGRVLVSTQTGLAVLLLAGAGLLYESYRDLTRLDPGFDPERLLHARFTPPPDVGKEERVQLYREMEARISALSGVEAVTLTWVPPGLGEAPAEVVRVAGGEERPAAERRVIWRPITPSYFETLGTPLRSGEGLDSPVDRPVVVNEAFVRRFLAGEVPLGRTVRREGPGGKGGPEEGWTIVGVAPDIHERYAYAPAPPVVYVGLRDEPPTSVALLARTQGTPGEEAEALRSTVASVAPDQPVYGVRAMTEMLRAEYDLNRLALGLLAVFAWAALVLSIAGVYGIVSHAVGRRTREIGIRIALGAERPGVRWLVVRDSGMAAAVGGLGGVGLVLVLADALTVLTPAWTGVAPGPLAFAVLVVGGAALASAYLPARRASSVDPIRILSAE